MDKQSAIVGIDHAQAVMDTGNIVDLRLTVAGKMLHLWGRGGRDKERQLADSVPAEALPVLLGPSLGVCLDQLVASGRPVAVVDSETAVWPVTGAHSRHAQTANVLWLEHGDFDTRRAALLAWQKQHAGAPFAPLMAPATRRIGPPLYAALADALISCNTFWANTRYPKFTSAAPRILLLDRPYFLLREIKDVLTRQQIPWTSVDVGTSETVREGFVEDLLHRVLEFRPDFVLTVNHFGMDREGRLAELLDSLGLPLASWFVDNPHLILAQYPAQARPNTAVFTWDADNEGSLRAQGFEHVSYLPLATDTHRFRPDLPAGPQAWRADVSFVGDSMARAVTDSVAACGDFPWLTEHYIDVATAFVRSESRAVSDVLVEEFPALFPAYAALTDPKDRLACESLITWEATRQYRWQCVNALAGHRSLIVGDVDGWRGAFQDTAHLNILPRLDYYADLPRLYPLSRISLNCTSRQMKGAVNQRVFDVPACGGFVLTDNQPQLAQLFEPGLEVLTYADPAEIPERLASLLRDGTLRRKISAAARWRIGAEHTYEHRIAKLCHVMRASFG